MASYLARRKNLEKELDEYIAKGLLTELDKQVLLKRQEVAMLAERLLHYYSHHGTKKND